MFLCTLVAREIHPWLFVFVKLYQSIIFLWLRLVGIGRELYLSAYGTVEETKFIRNENLERIQFCRLCLGQTRKEEYIYLFILKYSQVNYNSVVVLLIKFWKESFWYFSHSNSIILFSLYPILNEIHLGRVLYFTISFLWLML